MFRGNQTLKSSLAALALVATSGAALAQNAPRKPQPGALARGGERTASQAPDGLVYVSQVIDLSDQIGEDEEVYSLDGEPLPRMRTTNVTIGVLIDGGHVVTRLANVSPDGPQPEVRVISSQGSPASAHLVGMDAVTGLCVLQVKGNLAARPARESALAKPAALPAQRAVKLIGFHPLQAGGKVNVAALVRPRLHTSDGSVVKAEKDFRFSRSNPIYQLTTTTPLTPVQDGSLIVEADGSVFGVVSFDTSGDGQHLAYPITRVRRIAAMVVQANNSIPHGWLGATSVNNLAAATSQRGRVADRGVRVAAVFPDSPADLAGVKTHDILLSISGRELSTVADLTNTLKQLPADSEVTLKVRRGADHKVMHLQAKLIPAPAVEPRRQVFALAERMEDMEASASEMPTGDPKRHSLESKAVTMRQILSGITSAAPPEVRLRVMYGLEVQPLPAQLAKALSAPGGVLVATAAPSGKAGQAGLHAGDVIVKVGEQPVADTGSVMLALGEAKGETIELFVVREQQPLKLSLRR
jgi:S1-C subfamily serine protease